MTLYTEKYAGLNRELHMRNPSYGTSTPRYLPQIKEMADAAGAKRILDYGCGKGLLKKSVATWPNKPGVTEYDIGIPGKDKRPVGKFDLVVCTDVMEHIEPEFLQGVLQDIAEYSTSAVFLTVATRPAVKTLADGRNAHLIVEQVDWWLPRIMSWMSPRLLQVTEGEFIFFGIAKRGLVQ